MEKSRANSRAVKKRPARRRQPAPSDGPAAGDEEEQTREPVGYQLAGVAIKPPGGSVRSARRYVRERTAAVLPEIVSGLLEEALAGKLPELKLLVQMGGACDAKQARAGKKAKSGSRRCVEDILLDEWRKEPVDEA